MNHQTDVRSPKLEMAHLLDIFILPNQEEHFLFANFKADASSVLSKIIDRKLVHRELMHPKRHQNASSSKERQPSPNSAFSRSNHGCQMAVAKIYDCGHLALRASRTMAPLRCAAKFDPFLSLNCAPTPSALAQSKER